MVTNLKNPTSDVNYPYDSIPTIAPTIESNVFEHEEPGLYTIRLSNCRFTSAFECNYIMRNISGNDLRLSDQGMDYDRVLRVLGATNTGRYIAGVIETEKVGPGLSDSGSFSIGGPFKQKPEMVYLILAPDGRNQPVAQMIFK